ncbi:TetR/AcrR family transcriptional regulator [Pseudorhodobacter sp. MZDSW-24AT]|uniref:TetR/AcrR family transcriptional regulator n=1 Tax=Pseudorhodobacter sp. MZDSW-24AT TaxID=2052957 RepID=UPI000C1E555C|nr:TetR/AcrR family transcriptional regulator [Pseudorhodobacter sp. MZDSW-24AT]PJF09304.1 TetR/AcrR family transcriptional regulator [Pseudorhodobacter sp. MZDSW-24AT]
MTQIAPSEPEAPFYTGVAERLIEAGMREFVRHGFQGASISQIVEAAECNVRMIYHYFGNKLGLYRACIDRAYAELRQAEREATFWSLPPRAAMAELVRFTYDYMVAHPEFQGLMRIENMADGAHVRGLEQVSARAESLFDAIARVLDAGRAAGAFSRRPDPGRLYLTILGLCTIHVSNRHTMGVVMGCDLADPVFLADRREEVVAVVLAALGAAA